LATLRSLLNSPPHEREADSAQIGTADRI
jgi:hypothetical protein